ncbi:MAG: hypothetical protein NVV68_06735 [Dokdonella sp.]|nr:hypothetical protein [Dokdonella sp.]
MRRFPARPGTPTAVANSVIVVVPPPSSGGGGSGDGGDPGPSPGPGDLALFVDGCVSVSDGRMFVLGLHGLSPDDEVLWTATAFEPWNYIVSADGVTSDGHTCLAVYLGGALRISVAVGGEEIGTFDAEAPDAPADCVELSNPHP